MADVTVRPRRAVRRLGRVPVLRGGPVRRRGGGGGGEAEGRRDDPGQGDRPCRALRVGPRRWRQRAPRAERGRRGRGGAFNVVPDAGELLCDVRADSLAAIDAVADAIPGEVGGARLEAELLRRWPPMDSREATAGLLARAADAAGRRILAGGRGGASDASHFAPAIALTVDGLGPRGGAAHNPEEHVFVD